MCFANVALLSFVLGADQRRALRKSDAATARHHGFFGTLHLFSNQMAFHGCLILYKDIDLLMDAFE